ncbi:MAG: SHOCT domain-containing protein [Firmicutes bacterium]|nr:SHOCT domain-containing protein [Bacillota bacterium]
MDIVELLKQYKALLENGLMTQEEFDEKKKALLEQLELVSKDMNNNISEEFSTTEEQMKNEDIVENKERESNEFDQAEQLGSVVQQDVTDLSENNGEDVQNISERSLVESGAITETVVPKPKKLKIPIIIGAAALVLAIIIGIAVLGGDPKATSIEASYDGYTNGGTLIDSSSPFKVTATLEDGSTQEVSGWTVDETYLQCGFNDITVKYQDVQTTITIYSPLVENGKYVASVDNINETIDRYATRYLTNYTGLSEDAELDAVYDFDGVGFESRVSYTKKSGNENVAVAEDEVPNTVIYTSMLGSNEIETYTQDLLETASVVYVALDPDVSIEDARDAINDSLEKSMDNVDSSGMGDSTTSLDNLKLVSSVMFLPNTTMVVFSFQEL